MTYRAARLLRLPGRTVQVGELVEEGEVPPHKLGSYTRLGMLVAEAKTSAAPKSRKVRSATVTVGDAPAPEPEVSEEDET